MDGSSRGINTTSIIMPADREQSNKIVGNVPKPIPAFLSHISARKLGKALLRMASRQKAFRHQAAHSENSKNHDRIKYTFGSVTTEY